MFFNRPSEQVLSSASRVSRAASAPLFVLGSTGAEPRNPIRRSLSDREPTVLLPNPRPSQMACWESSSSEPDHLFVLGSDAPFALGVDILSASNKRAKARSRALKPLASPESPEKLVLLSEEPLAPKKVRSLNFEEGLPLISPKRVCSVVTFRI
jgi:hypothetical protein